MYRVYDNNNNFTLCTMSSLESYNNDTSDEGGKEQATIVGGEDLLVFHQRLAIRVPHALH